MGTQVAVTSIKISQAPDIVTSGIVVVADTGRYITDRSSSTIELHIETPSNPLELKFYLDPSDNTKAYSQSFTVVLTLVRDTSGRYYQYQKKNITLCISAKVSGTDPNGTPILSEPRLTNVGWSDPFTCMNCVPQYNNCKAIVGTSTVLTPSNATSKSLISINIQYRTPNSTTYTNGIIILGYDSFGDVRSTSYTLPPVPTGSAMLPQVILSISNPE
mgnify:CR=1 FL=1